MKLYRTGTFWEYILAWISWGEDILAWISGEDILKLASTNDIPVLVSWNRHVPRSYGIIPCMEA
jgi:hypothetical protein